MPDASGVRKLLRHRALWLVLVVCGLFLVAWAVLRPSPAARPEASSPAGHVASNVRSGGPANETADTADNAERSAARTTPTPEAQLGLTTVQLLEAMKAAYLAADNVKLETLRAHALSRSDLELPVIRRFYWNLIIATHERHDNLPTLENAVADVLLHAWPLPDDAAGRAAWQEEVFRFVLQVVQSNEFVEFNGTWKDGAEKHRQSNVLYQREWFVRPASDVDTIALAWLVDESLKRSGIRRADKVSLAGVFGKTKDYVEDRLAYFQVYVCGLLVRLNAAGNLDDLWKLANEAHVQEVRAAALDAYIKIGGRDQTVEVASRWAESVLRAPSQTDNQVLDSLAALITQDIGWDTSVPLTRAFFQQLDAAGVDWEKYSLRMVKAWTEVVSNQQRLDDLRARRHELLALLRDEKDPAMLLAWRFALSTAYGNSGDAEVLQLLKGRLLEIVRAPELVKSWKQRDAVVSTLVHAYAVVLDKPRKGEFVALFEGAYAVAMPLAHQALDYALVHVLATNFGQSLAEYFVPYERVVPLMAAASERQIPAMLNIFYYSQIIRDRFFRSWAALQCELAAATLSDLAAEATSDQARQFFQEVHLEWQKEADRRAGRTGK